MNIVRIIKGNQRIARKEFHQILEELGLLEKLRSARTICIKPNLAAGGLYLGDSGVVVDRGLLENVLVCLRSLNAKAEIRILESDSTGGGYTYLKFQNQGYAGLTEKYAPLRLVDLSREELKRVEVEGSYFKTVDIGQSVFSSDFFISMAKMKTHNMTIVTGAVKNLFGCLPDSDKSHYHAHINQVVADLADIIPVDLAIVDGNPGMEGNGPVRGTPKLMDRILIGNDAVATDKVMAEVMGVDCSKVQHLRLASQKRGIGHGLSEIRVTGVPITEALVDVQEITLGQRVIVNCGIFVQRIGQKLYILGHKIHYQNNVKSVIRVLIVSLASGVLPQSWYDAIKHRVKKWTGKD